MYYSIVCMELRVSKDEYTAHRVWEVLPTIYMAALLQFPMDASQCTAPDFEAMYTLEGHGLHPIGVWHAALGWTIDAETAAFVMCLNL